MPETPSPVSILQSLLRFDTTNPPGAEEECISWISGLMSSAGIEHALHSRSSDRPNLVARIRGDGDAAPLLLYGHVDVVTTAHQDWKYPPFSATIADGLVWGRGALDMKSAVAMMLSAVLQIASGQANTKGDVILAVVSDEEAGGTEGAGFLVEQHAELFAGVRHALGELGGFTQHIAGKRFYPIMVAEKQTCRVTMRVRGASGHGSVPVYGETVARLSRLLSDVDRRRLPVHVTHVVRRMIESIADHLPAHQGIVMRSLLRPALTDIALRLLGDLGPNLSAVLRNTVAATIISSGSKINVIPGDATVVLDGRILRGQTEAGFARELRELVGDDVEIETEMGPAAPGEPDMSQYDMLGSILSAMDPGGIPIPMLLPGVTDARHFSRLGIQTYGFTPMRLPPELPYTRLIHAADERIPVDALEFGTKAMVEAITRYSA